MVRQSVMSISLLLLLQTIPGHAATIADLTGDFTPVTVATGWQYLRNTALIGSSANYVPLLWAPAHNRFNVDGVNHPTPGFDYTFLQGSGMSHPGPGTAQGGAFNGYMIAAYTVQPGESGLVTLVNGSIRGTDPAGASGASNGWDVRIFIGDDQSGPVLTFPWSLGSASFSQSLGPLGVGDTVFVAFGPNGNHLFDSVALQFQLDSTPIPEPHSALQIGMGLCALLALSLGIRCRHLARVK